ncbi:hypothetical protein UFOVP1282_11 [uncultured Caudovirales phage]|uniref:Uncharacterized protein n=1 Tax=uncultured Caudovirales phage TaxID=2100421 RepID=A0A6J5PIX6_9CAUD|nr:hypothetical protein UFOVP888_12 [uncultured Caudovirales phage]CAB4194724.1 hypothetical protein UFOVP1282_11 [uncultured Caudovirales phage]
MAKPATLKVDIVSDSRQARSDLDSFSGKIAGFTAGVTSAVTGFAIDKIAELATSAGQQLLDGVSKAASLSASLGTLTYNYGEAAQTIEAFAASAATSFGLSKLSAVEAANRFSVYAKAIKLTGGEAAGFSVDLTKLAGNLGAFADLPTEDAINAIGSAFRGERDPIEKYGILLNDASVKAGLFRRTGEQVTGTLTTQQNILGTLQVLQEKGVEIGDAYGREQEQLGNKTKNASAQFENMKAKIGEFLLPAFTSVTDFISTNLLPGLEGLVDAFRTGGLSGLFEELGKKWEQALPGIDQFIQALPGRITTYLNENLPDFTAWTAQASKWITDAILGTGTEENPGLLVRMAQLARGITDAAENSKDGFRSSGSKIGGYLVEGLINTFTSYVSDSLKNYFTWDNLKTIIFGGGNPFNFVGRVIGEIMIGGIKSVFEKLADWIYRTIWNAVKRGMGGLWGGVLNLLGLNDSAYADTVSGSGTSSVSTATAIEITVNAGFGTNGQDVGAAIAAELTDYYARNGVPY